MARLKDDSQATDVEGGNRMTLEEKASRYAFSKYPEDMSGNRDINDIRWDVRDAYMAGAKENMVEWHTEPPAYNHFCISEHGAMVYWNAGYQQWQDALGDFTEVKAWCEIPIMKEEL